ncbi:MAG TPA: CPBP family intramembrane glutamic endopeptidase [Usitatibacteraceae bacterium]|nr:CPBP family intramembrane glutamic endopeptidase [Usitatibacteraceae bacterium]
MPAPTGLQIAFLAFAFEFFSMLASKTLAPLIHWPADQFALLGQLISFSMATLILFGFPGLRKRCLSELRVPVPAGSSPELIAASIAHLAVPFAVVGGVVMQAFATGSADQLLSRIPTNDPSMAWEDTLSPPGLLRLFLLAWFVGPVIEELVFRGFLYRAFERQWGWPVSMALTSFLFGLAHPTHIAAAALGSVILICVLRRTGSLRACIFVHITFNILISWPLFGQVLLTAPKGLSTSIATWSIQLACLAFAAVALPAYVWMSRKAKLPAGDGEVAASPVHLGSSRISS